MAECSYRVSRSTIGNRRQLCSWIPAYNRGNDTDLIILQEMIKPVAVEDVVSSAAELLMISVESNLQRKDRAQPSD
jgi:hypothetical protein